MISFIAKKSRVSLSVVLFCVFKVKKPVHETQQEPDTVWYLHPTPMLSEQIEIACAEEVKCGNFSALCTSTNMMGLSDGKGEKKQRIAFRQRAMLSEEIA